MTEKNCININVYNIPGVLVFLLVVYIMTSTLSQKLENVKRKQNAKTVACIRCGVCMRVCCHHLSPVLIKEAFDKSKKEQLRELKVELCDGCGNCSYVCPSRIDLRGSVLRAKASVR